MSKLCIFCGKKPKKKTKEHVVPKWLINLTGDPRRDAMFGFTKNRDKKIEGRKFSFNQFTFPACATCNNKYSELENNAKTILNKIMSNELIITEDLSLFLDWLDKVRVGIWLGMLQLDKNYTGINPNFYIETRVSQFDRVLIIEKTSVKENRLNFLGTDTPSFTMTPSAFCLIINNYYFTNISYMYLLHKNLGFPYPEKKYARSEDEAIEMDFSFGSKCITKPLLERTIEEKGLVFYQPMFRGGLSIGERPLYNNDYIKEHSMDFKNGIGNIFREKNGDLIEYKKEDSFLAVPEIIPFTYDSYNNAIKAAINVLEWQNWLTSLMPSFDRLRFDQKQFVKTKISIGLDFNNQIIRHLELNLS